MNAENTYPTDKKRISKTLYIFAWVIEVFAVITGLLISVLVGISTYRQNKLIDESGGVTDFTNVLIAALPFFMVSIVELAKIPTAQAMYATTRFFWKSIFILVLIFLALITFETALNGFERNFTSLNYQVTQLVTKREELIGRYAFMQQQNIRDQSLTRESVIGEFDRQNQLLVEKRDRDFDSLAQIEAGMQTAAGDVQSSAIREKISDYRSQKESLTRQRDQEIAAIQGDADTRRAAAQADAESRRSDLQRQLQREEGELSNVRAECSNRITNANILTRSGIRDECDSLIIAQQQKVSDIDAKLLNFSVSESVLAQSGASSSEIQLIVDRYQTRIDDLDAKIEAENVELATRAGATQIDITGERARLNSERARIQAQYDSDLKVLQQRSDQDFETVGSLEARIADNDTKMRVLDEQLSDVRSQINEQAKDNQIYRLANMFDTDAKTVADVDMTLVNLVAKVWFGSLAMVIAITGIVLALASEVVKDPRNTSSVDTPKAKYFGRSFRALALAINRINRRKPKLVVEIREVVKEIPVDRVVFRDKIQEIIKKEVVHVPIYTNDPSLLRKQDVPT